MANCQTVNRLKRLKKKKRKRRREEKNREVHDIRLNRLLIETVAAPGDENAGKSNIIGQPDRVYLINYMLNSLLISLQFGYYFC